MIENILLTKLLTVVRATGIQAKQDDFDGVMAVVTVNTDNNIGWFTFGYGPLLKIRVETASIELPYEDIKDITANWKEGFSTRTLQIIFTLENGTTQMVQLPE